MPGTPPAIRPEQLAPMAGDGPLVAGCAITDCEAKWKEIDKETNDVASIEDPIERNKKISAKYAELNRDSNGQIKWAGLAAYTSTQAGCAMRKAKVASGSWLPMKSGPAGAAYRGLGTANRTIFKDIYPPMRFHQKHGAAALDRCKGLHEPPVPDKLVDAAKAIESGNPDLGAEMIAEYEQKVVVEDQVYKADKDFAEALEKNDYWSQKWIGRALGAEKTEIPLAPNCGEGTPIAYPEGKTILDKDARVEYYEKLIKEYDKKTGGTGKLPPEDYDVILGRRDKPEGQF